MHSVDIDGVPAKDRALWRVLSARRGRKVTLAFYEHCWETEVNGPDELLLSHSASERAFVGGWAGATVSPRFREVV